ncbi:mandelate racemase/muconate lactonizing protein [Scytonema sp. HK-05]|uniref:o-succinylbenzoate synthase n=1 Tax=Scytonema sp. HK-05 TaxID=1137095 RepID=UPI00093578D6|nr:o-succinylbenzoate synthase [Scytonema sp. HK-05]OKH58317.1 o-succinylbenzoate synthase [Scytonema sp. HK-05]BAY43913.1 mandelate racemase/muconate lactonizing protein [Scytonema sp. HK-05]
MRYRFEFRPYQQRFVRSLTTSHGTWDIREGIILRLTDETGKIGWGEIAPISWFGSETLEQALEFCHELSEEITQEMIFSIPDQLPACQFGFESAWETNRQDAKNAKFFCYSGLLPAGEAALQTWQSLWEQGYRTFKWKIGVYPIAKELEIFELLAQTLPTSAKLRLDANGGLKLKEANVWLRACDNIKANEQLSLEIEFIEQPLSVDQFQAMLELTHDYKTAIALDESVATLNQLTRCFKQGWRGIFVIKPGIVGSPSRLRQFCQQHKIDAVFSSVFETAIGRQAALQLAAELSQGNRAVGFGVNHWFAQEETLPEALWKKL